MRVFISHKDVDADTARTIAGMLKQHGFASYLDVLDDGLIESPSGLTEHIRTQMESCSHLLAIISESTRLSWWVPFEIGLATEKGFTIASYVKASVKLPDYLKVWPYLNREEQILIYLQELGRSGLHFESFSERTAAVKLKGASNFHRTLKRALGQQ